MRKTLALLCAVSSQALIVMPATAAENAGASTIEELVVTAQKRSESLQDVPAAISAISRTDLQDRGFTTPAQLQFIVPSMQVGKQNGVAAITIRGVGMNMTQGSPGVAVHIDGVFQPRASMGDLTQTDLERVEVLRGPQGTTYGRNATGGVVNYITGAPTNAFEGFVLGSYKTYDESRLQGVVNVPFGDRVRTRLVIDRTERGKGFVRNVGVGPDSDYGTTLSGRLRIAADLGSNLSLDIGLTGWHRDASDTAFTLISRPIPGSPFLPAMATANIVTKPRQITSNGPLGGTRDLGAASATLEWTRGTFSLKSITAYQRFAETSLDDFDATNIGGFQGTRIRRSRTLTEELNAGFKTDRIDVIVGGFYFRDNDYYYSQVDLPNSFNGLPPNSALFSVSPRYYTRSKAAFADATVNATDRLQLIAGIRYSQDEIAQTQINTIRAGSFATITTCTLRTNTVTYNSTTNRLGIQYDIADNNNLYATYSRGFKSGGFNLNACNNKYAPEKLTSYEIGLKNRLFDGSVVLNLSGFYYDYTDLQLSQILGPGILISNASAAELKGLEAEGIWRPDSHLTFSGNVAFLDAKYKRFLNIDQLRPARGIQNLAGKRMAKAPKFSMNLSAAYQTDPVIAGGSLTARADVSYRSKMYFREFNLPDDTQKSYSIVDLALVWDSPDEKYKVRLFVENLTNKDYINYLTASSPDGSNIANWGTPRQAGVELRAAF